MQPDETINKSIGEQPTFDGGDSSVFDFSDLAEGFDENLEVVDLSGRYQQDSVIGRGGMGEVLKATDTRLKRPVAIKRIHGDMAGSSNALRRFLTEAQAVAALNHYNIVQVFDYGRDSQGPFLILEYVDGQSLAELLAEDVLETERAVHMVCQLCNALSLAHAKGIVHRDIKPANILITRDGVPKLTDFGLARHEQADHTQTVAGAVLGTPDFMPPEQRLDAKQTDARSDLWSLAATLYQMLTGKVPRVIRVRELPDSLQDVVTKALEDDPPDRYQTADAFRDALKEAMSKLAGESQTHATEALVEGQCSACNGMNPADRRFCGKCGASLVAPCIVCDSENSVWQRFCGGCGVNIEEALSAKRHELDEEKSEIESLRSQYHHIAAIQRLEALAALDHPALADYRAWAQESSDRFTEELERLKGQSEELLQRAQRLSSESDDAGALRILNRIPELLWTDEAVALRDESKARIAAVRELKKKINDALAAKEYDGLSDVVEQFLQLRPTNESAKRLKGQLKKRRRREEARREPKEDECAWGDALSDLSPSIRALAGRLYDACWGSPNRGAATVALSLTTWMFVCIVAAGLLGERQHSNRPANSGNPTGTSARLPEKPTTEPPFQSASPDGTDNDNTPTAADVELERAETR